VHPNIVNPCFCIPELGHQKWSDPARFLNWELLRRRNSLAALADSALSL
jgi:hypothetical protein